MLQWLRQIFEKDPPSAINSVHVSRHEVKHPWLIPNLYQYNFPDPVKMRCVRVKFHCTEKKRKKKRT